MSRKNNIKKAKYSDQSQHYKTYKAKKTWIYTTITSFAAVFGGGLAAPIVGHADTSSTTTSTSKEADTGNILAANNTATIPADSTNNNTAVSTSESTSGSTSTASESTSGSTSGSTSTATNGSRSTSESDCGTSNTSESDS